MDIDARCPLSGFSQRIGAGNRCIDRYAEKARYQALKYFRSQNGYFHMNIAFTIPGSAIKDVLPEAKTGCRQWHLCGTSCKPSDNFAYQKSFDARQVFFRTIPYA